MARTYTILYNNRLIAVMVVAALACACDGKEDWISDLEPSPSYEDNTYEEITPGREIDEDTRKVMLLYSAGVNSLYSFLASDIRDLCSGWLPKTRRTDDVLLIYSHIGTSGYANNTYEPTLTRVYTDNEGTVFKDTLVTYPEETVSSSAEQLNKVLTYVRDRFPAKSYGMIFSSHATGYLPSGYYSGYSESVFNAARRRQDVRPAVPVPYIVPEHDPSLPMVKSIGQDVSGSLSYEMELSDFAAAIPMKLDYLLFDACLMGGIETAYELKEKCSRLGASQTEVLAEGFNYETLTTHLLYNRNEADPASVCEDYFRQYDIQNGVYRSATISLIDCGRLEPLAELCRELFEKYRTGLDGITPSKVQRFYRSSKHWFYDLESIITEAGATEEDLLRLQTVLDDCVIYKGNTPSFMGAFNIDTFSGFSMYLPCNGSTELDEFYRTLKWNEATGLVR
ncbi:MAG: hypothetical protein IJ005_05135 [Bacteroidales bacterium]|nr:hypothetical protein [Bacteroidales bacterium]